MRHTPCQACGSVGRRHAGRYDGRRRDVRARVLGVWLRLSSIRTPFVAVVAATVVGGCTTASGSRAPRGDRNLLTQEQLLATHQTNLYDIVEALRSNWLRTHGVDSFAAPTPVWVYFDDARLGGIESLRAVSPHAVTYVRYYDGVAATARWGVGHGQGVIFISSYPR